MMGGELFGQKELLVGIFSQNKGTDSTFSGLYIVNFKLCPRIYPIPIKIRAHLNFAHLACAKL